MPDKNIKQSVVTQAHTPTPWPKVKAHFNSIIEVNDRGLNTIADIHEPQWQKRIVRAVNSHQALIDALEGSMESSGHVDACRSRSIRAPGPTCSDFCIKTRHALHLAKVA